MKKKLSVLLQILVAAGTVFCHGNEEPADISVLPYSQDPVVADSNWPCFRGAAHDGIYYESDFNTEKLSADAVLWKKNIGEGYSAPSIYQGKLYILGHEKPNDFIRCLDAESGKELWNFKYGTYTDRDYPGPRASPTYSDGKIYTLGRGGDLYCLDADTGKKIWSTKLESHGAENLTWNYASSVLISGDMAIVNAAKYGLAFNKDTGKLIWKSPEGTGGYASPVQFSFKGKEYLAMFGKRDLYTVELQTGKLWWSFPWYTSYEVNAGNPLIIGNYIFVATGYYVGCALYDFSSGEPVQVWKNKNIISHFNSFIYYKEKIYTVSGDAGNSRTSSFRCIDPANGKLVWEKRLGFGSAILADDKFILLNESGEVYIFEASISSYNEIKSARFDPGTYWTAPVISRGLLYIRSKQGLLTCIDLSV